MSEYFDYNAYFIAAITVLSVMLTVLVGSLIGHVLVIRKRGRGSQHARSWALYLAWFMTVVFFVLLLVTYAISYDEAYDLTTDSYPIIYLFQLITVLAAEVFLLVVVTQLVKESFAFPGHMRIYNIFSLVVIVLLAALAIAEIGLDAYVTAVAVNPDVIGINNPIYYPLNISATQTIVDIAFNSLYIFALCIALGALVANFTTSRCRKAYLTATAFAIVVLLATIALGLAEDVISYKQLAYQSFDFDATYEYPVSSPQEPTETDLEYQPVGWIVSYFTQACVLVILLFVPLSAELFGRNKNEVSA